MSMAPRRPRVNTNIFEGLISLSSSQMRTRHCSCRTAPDSLCAGSSEGRFDKLTRDLGLGSSSSSESRDPHADPPQLFERLSLVKHTIKALLRYSARACRATAKYAQATKQCSGDPMSSKLSDIRSEERLLGHEVGCLAHNPM